MRMKTSKGVWKIFGICLTKSDALYTKIKDAIENDLLTQEHLQKVTGHLLPINVDMQQRTITFSNI